MTYNIIGTGSSGNAVLLGEHILIDCGVSYKKLEPALRDIRLVLLTHKHGDHFNKTTIKKLADERPLIRWACCGWMAPELSSLGVSPYHIDCIAENQALNYPNLARVRPETVFHDVPNCCWHIEIGGWKAFYCTDTGHLDGIQAKDYHLYMIEANHTKEEIKQRVNQKTARGEYVYEFRAAQNHLSYEQANDWLVNNAGSFSEIVYLHQHKEK